MGRRALLVERTADLAARPTRVWQIVSHHEGAPDWMPVREVVRRRPGHPHADGVGALRTVRGGGLVVEEEVVAFEPERRLAWRLLCGAPVRDHEAEITLAPTATGTRVRWCVRFRPRIPGTGWLLARRLSSAIESGLDGLQRFAESGAAPRKRGKMRRA